MDGLIAVGIFRGEGTISCSLMVRDGRIEGAQLRAAVSMCDRDSVQIVASAWKTSMKPAPSVRCGSGLKGWRTMLSGDRRVRETIGGWIAEGWLRGEKAEQYFEAVAKCRRAWRVFIGRTSKRASHKERNFL